MGWNLGESGLSHSRSWRSEAVKAEQLRELIKFDFFIVLQGTGRLNPSRDKEWRQTPHEEEEEEVDNKEKEKRKSPSIRPLLNDPG